MLLLSDGSVTRHLSLLANKKKKKKESGVVDDDAANEEDEEETTEIYPEVLSMRTISREEAISNSPKDAERVEGERIVRREVFLRRRQVKRRRSRDKKKRMTKSDYDDDDDNATDAVDDELPLAYACSWWNAEAADRLMRKREETMLNNLRDANVELYREVKRVYVGKNGALARRFGCEDEDEEIWGRHYIFWSEGKPVTVVYEAFSPLIERAFD